MIDTLVIGGGAAGLYLASLHPGITILERGEECGRKLILTGGGRCNLAYAEFNFKELAKFYPRGEKFLYSVFSKFSTRNTVDFFNRIGINTYIQEDLRIFPETNSSKDIFVIQSPIFAISINFILKV